MQLKPSQTPLARRGLVPYQTLGCPADYRPAFASSFVLYPPAHGLTSRLAGPRGETTGLPRCTDVPGWGRSQLSAGGASSAPQEFGPCGPDHMPFWPRRVSILPLSSLTTFSPDSRQLTNPPDPGPRGTGGPGRTWSAEEDGLVRTLPPQEVADRTGRTLVAVWNRRRKLKFDTGEKEREFSEKRCNPPSDIQ